jgi:hypothetical protein
MEVLMQALPFLREERATASPDWSESLKILE